MVALYVGDLHPDVTEVMLLERFSPAGPIRSIRLCRDRNNGSSLGYAYINYKHQAYVERAVDMLNFELLMGQPMRVMRYQKDPAMRKNGIGNLFLKNLDKSIDSMALFDTFSIFGKILSCKVVGYETGSKAYGYVQFESEEAAELAMQKLNGKLLNDRQVFIEQFKTRELRKAEVGPRSKLFTNIYIKNLREDVNDQLLNDIFSKFGPTGSVKVMRDENGNSKGFGFARFERHEDAQRAVEKMNGKELNGRQIYVGPAQTKAERQAELKKRKDTNGRMWGRKPAENYPAKDIALTADRVPAVDIAPTVDRAPAEDVVPTVDRAPVKHIVPTVDRAPVKDIIPTVDQVPAEDIVPTVDRAPVKDIIPTVDQVPAEDIVPTVDRAPAEDIVPTVDKVPAEDIVPTVDRAPAKDIVPTVDKVPAEDIVPTVDRAPAEDIVPTVDQVPAEDIVPTIDPGEESTSVIWPALHVDSVPDGGPSDDVRPAATQAPDADKAPSASVAALSEVQQDKVATDGPTSPPARKPLTIYMLESVPVDDQIQMAYDYIFPFVEELHPTLASKITWMLLEGENNFEIVNMTRDSELLRAKVDEMDALLKAREAGHKPEALKIRYSNKNNNRKRRNKNRRQN